MHETILKIPKHAEFTCPSGALSVARIRPACLERRELSAVRSESRHGLSDVRHMVAGLYQMSVQSIRKEAQAVPVHKQHVIKGTVGDS